MAGEMLILTCLAEMLETHVDSFDLCSDGFLHLQGTTAEHLLGLYTNCREAADKQ